LETTFREGGSVSSQTARHILTLIFRPPDEASDILTIIPSWATVKVATSPSEIVNLLENEFENLNISVEEVRRPGGFGDALHALTARPFKHRELVYDLDEMKIISLKEVKA
jgi:hypothetical protein